MSVNRISESSFDYTVDRHTTLRSGIDAALPGLLDNDTAVATMLTIVEAMQKGVIDYVKTKYCHDHEDDML